MNGNGFIGLFKCQLYSNDITGIKPTLWGTIDDSAMTISEIRSL